MLKALALKLACLHSLDREWIIGQLTSSERKAIEPLLAEINELGLNADVSTVKAVLAEIKDKTHIPELNINGFDQLHVFWQRALLSSMDKSHFRVLIDTDTNGLTGVSPLESIPPKVLSVLLDLTKK